jgi:hypothetical protein
MGWNEALLLESFWNRMVFGILAASVGIAGLACFGNLQTLLMNWSSFVDGWQRIL